MMDRPQLPRRPDSGTHPFFLLCVSIEVVFLNHNVLWFLFKTLAAIVVVICNFVIWKAIIPLKIKVFLWQLYQDAIQTRDNMRKRNWPRNSRCSFVIILKPLGIYSSLMLRPKCCGELWDHVFETDTCPHTIWQNPDKSHGKEIIEKLRLEKEEQLKKKKLTYFSSPSVEQEGDNPPMLKLLMFSLTSLFLLVSEGVNSSFMACIGSCRV